eukprot:Hpha_TRINITY_DN16260_c0_g10::TRINITY_DN16260_c0_g10_i1::g.12947::m.12947
MPPDAAAAAAGAEEGEDQGTSLEHGGPNPETHASLKFYHALGFSPGALDNSGSAVWQGRRVMEHISDDSVVYIAAKHVAVFSYELLQHRFILKNTKTSRIMAFCVSANRRYIALSETLLDPVGGVQVSVYNFNTAFKVRQLGMSFFREAPVVAMDFSRDNKYLACVTDGPSPCIYTFQLEKQRQWYPPQETHQRVGQISVSPFAHWMLCTTGVGHLKIWQPRVNEQTKTSELGYKNPVANLQRDYRFTCHAWFDDEKVVAGTADGDILVVEGDEVRRVIQAPLGGKAVWCLHCIGRGFICGGDEGIIGLFERTFDAAHFGLYRLVRAPDSVTGSRGGVSARAVDISINPSEDSVVVAFDNNEVAQFALAQIDNLPGYSAEAQVTLPSTPAPGEAAAAGGATTAQRLGGGGANHFRRLPIGFHQEMVTGVDVCIQRSVLVTSSLDGHIRVWNYAKKRVEIDYYAGEKVYSVAVHPAGHVIAAGLQRMVAFFVVLSNDLHRCHELPAVKQCRELRYSPGGQYIACVANPPYVRISVYDAYTFLPLGYRESASGFALTGHSAAVQSVCWSRNDNTLYSAGFEGAIFEWRVHKGKRNEQNEWMSKFTNYSCLRYDDETQTLVGLGTQKQGMSGEGCLDMVEGEMCFTTFSVKHDGPRPKGERKALTPEGGKEDPHKPSLVRVPPPPTGDAAKAHRQSNIRSGQVAISTLAKTLFVGTQDGKLLLYEWPPCGYHTERECSCGRNKEGEPPRPYCSLEIHQGEVLFVILSVDERYIFTIGAEDRCLFMLEVDTISEGRAVTRKVFPYSAFEGVSFVLQQELDDKARLAVELRSYNEELKRRQTAEQTKMEQTHRTEMRRIGEEARKEIDFGARDRDKAVQAADAELRKAQDEEEERTSAQLKASEELETLYTRRTADLAERQRALEAEKNDFVVRYENKLHKRQAERHATLRALDGQKKGIEQENAASIEDLHKAKKDAARDMDGMIDFTIQDYIEEIDALEAERRHAIHEKTAMIATTRSETALIATKESKHAREIESLQEVIEQKQTESRELEEKGKALQMSTEKLKFEISQRNEDISAREKQILELKKNTAELEKLRYVLTYKFGELRKEVAPKEEKIKEMNDRIQQMDLELERIGMDRDRLRGRLLEKRDATSQLLTGLEKHNRMLDDRHRQVSQLLHKLTKLVAGLDAEGNLSQRVAVPFAFTAVGTEPEVKETVKGWCTDANVTVVGMVDILPAEGGTALLSVKDDAHFHAAEEEWRRKPPGVGVRMRIQSDQERLWTRLSRVVQQYASRYEEGIGVEEERERAREFERQRDYMNEKLVALQQTNRRAEQVLRMDNQRKTEENARLVREINELRQAKRHLHLRHQQAESQLKEARAHLQRQTSGQRPPVAPGAAGAASPSRTRPSSAPEPRQQAGTPDVVLRPTHTPQGVMGRGPPVRGRLIKGSTRSLRDLSAMDAESIGEIIRQVERTNGEILAQGGEIKRLRDFVQHLLARSEPTAVGQPRPTQARQAPASAGASRLPRMPQARPMSAAF